MNIDNATTGARHLEDISLLGYNFSLRGYCDQASSSKHITMFSFDEGPPSAASKGDLNSYENGEDFYQLMPLKICYTQSWQLSVGYLAVAVFDHRCGWVWIHYLIRKGRIYR